jgi:hypothetical protein
MSLIRQLAEMRNMDDTGVERREDGGVNPTRSAWLP